MILGTSTTQRALDAITLVLALASLLLAPRAAPALALAVAALVALGTRAALFLAPLALFAALGSPPLTASATPLALLAPILGGAALGLLTRATEGSFTQRYIHLLPPIVALLIAFTFFLPGLPLPLATPLGTPLTATTTLMDGASLTRLPVTLPVTVLSAPPSWLTTTALALSLLAATVLLTRRASPRLLKATVALAVLATLAVAALGLTELLSAHPPIDPESLRLSTTLQGSPGATVLSVSPLTAGEFRLWSRPLIDPLRLLLALALALLVLAPPRSSTPAPEAHATLRPLASPLLPLGLALTLAALTFSAAASPHPFGHTALVLLAATLLGATTLFATALAPHLTSGPRLTLLGATLLSAYAWLLTPLLGA